MNRLKEVHEIVPDTVAIVPVFTVLAAKIQKLVATLATRTFFFRFCTSYFYVLCD